MDRPGSDAAGFPRTSFRQAIVSGLFMGWFAAAGLTMWGVSHPLLHSEWELPAWRIMAANRSLVLAPFTYFGPLVLAPAVAALAYRRGWNPPRIIANFRQERLGIRLQLLALFAIMQCLAFGVVLYFLRVVGRV